MLQEIGNLEPPETTEVRKCRRLYQYLLSKNKITVLQSIPRHCDTTGNEKTDAVTKKATLITETTDRENILSNPQTEERWIWQYDITITQRMAIRQSQKPWKDLITNTAAWPRGKTVLNFLLLTGHNCLAKYLYHIGLLSHLYCTLCDQQEKDRPAPFIEIHCFIFNSCKPQLLGSKGRMGEWCWQRTRHLHK